MGKEMREAKCPLCGERIKIGVKSWIGQRVECPACDAELEVVGFNPLSLDWPYDDAGYLSIDFDGEEEYQYGEDY
jgi:lysine biosynthesis protein LysW